jgi:hypothetical protein
MLLQGTCKPAELPPHAKRSSQRHAKLGKGESFPRDDDPCRGIEICWLEHRCDAGEVGSRPRQPLPQPLCILGATESGDVLRSNALSAQPLRKKVREATVVFLDQRPLISPHRPDFAAKVNGRLASLDDGLCIPIEGFSRGTSFRELPEGASEQQVERAALFVEQKSLQLLDRLIKRGKQPTVSGIFGRTLKIDR